MTTTRTKPLSHAERDAAHAAYYAELDRYDPLGMQLLRQEIHGLLKAKHISADMMIEGMRALRAPVANVSELSNGMLYKIETIYEEDRLVHHDVDRYLDMADAIDYVFTVEEHIQEAYLAHTAVPTQEMAKAESEFIRCAEQLGFERKVARQKHEWLRAKAQYSLGSEFDPVEGMRPSGYWALKSVRGEEAKIPSDEFKEAKRLYFTRMMREPMIGGQIDALAGAIGMQAKFESQRMALVVAAYPYAEAFICPSRHKNGMPLKSDIRDTAFREVERKIAACAQEKLHVRLKPRPQSGADDDAKKKHYSRPNEHLVAGLEVTRRLVEACGVAEYIFDAKSKGIPFAEGSVRFDKLVFKMLSEGVAKNPATARDYIFGAQAIVKECVERQERGR